MGSYSNIGELDFIRDYDIKYHMVLGGKETEDGED
jgi:hypothetical protein